MKKGFLRFILTVSFLVAFLLIPKNAYAATFKVEKSVDAIKPGQDVTVNIKGSDIGNDSIKDYSISLAYDPAKLEYKSHNNYDVSNITLANPIAIAREAGTVTDGATIATFVFTAKNSPGDANLTLTSNSCETISGNKNPCEVKSSMVKINGYSSDASLSSLKIPNATITPKFDKNIYEYKSTIQDITEITVNAIASDSNSKILISDNYKNLQKGENEIKITVTAEDGKTTKTYIIKVTLKLTPTDEEVLKASAELDDLIIKDYKIDFVKELKKYTLSVPYKIKELKITPKPVNQKATIKIDGNKNFKVGRNTVRITVKSEDEQNQEVYTLNVTREKEVKKIVHTCPDVTSSREWILFTSCMLFTFTLGIILGYFLSKKEVLKKIFKIRKKTDEEELSKTKEIPQIKKGKK